MTKTTSKTPNISTKPRQRFPLRAAALLALALGAGAALQGCALLIGGAAVGSAIMATDRRTSGTQVEDQEIEIKANARANAAVGNRGHINVTCYNRLVLLTGEVPSEADRTAAEQAVRQVENVRAIDNELAVMPNSSLGSRSNDTLLTTKVKATFVDAKDLQANAIKVVTERGTVYLMGIVTEREANRAANLAAGIAGVQKVVRVFEIVTEDQLAGIQQAVKPAEPASGPQ
jgi:osmotically-inducible protein OsmY